LQSFSPPCAQALLIVAHPDDETLFAGELLIGRLAALPGGCRRASWHVVCVTNGGSSSRRTDFRRAMLVARAHGLATDLTMEIWPFSDCNSPSCETFADQDGQKGPDLASRMNELLSGRTTGDRPWDFVITHNMHGEYHHLQHIGLHTAVVKALEGGAALGRAQLLVFNPLPELNVSLSIGKLRMAKAYLAGPDVKSPRLLLFDALTKYAEHVVPVDWFPRTHLLGLGYFDAAIAQGQVHFSYAWALAKHKNFGDLGSFSADKALPYVKHLLFMTEQVACSDRVPQRTEYPIVCSKLPVALEPTADGGESELHGLLRSMEAAAEYLPTLFATEPPDPGVDKMHQDRTADHEHETIVPLPGEYLASSDVMAAPHAAPTMAVRSAQRKTPRQPRPPDGAIAHIRCIRPGAPVGRFGEVQAWEVAGETSGPVWMELIAVRPILVGWRRGFHGRTFRILGGTGPTLVDLSPGSPTSPSGNMRTVRVRVQQSSSVPPLALQPHDVVGWGVYDAVEAPAATARATSRMVSASDEQLPEEACLRTLGCDAEGLCVFDTLLESTPLRVNDSASSAPGTSVFAVVEVVPELGPRRHYERPAQKHLGTTAAAPPFMVRPALDISNFVDATTSYEEFMTFRNRLDHPDLGLFEDKIRLRLELLPEVGVRATPSIHLSYSDTNILRHIEGRRAFVVKPSHMSESQLVFVVRDGVDMLRRAWGHPSGVTAAEIQRAADTFLSRKALDWECRALTGARPGIIVEELMLAEDAEGKLRVDEYKFYIVWGEVVFGENVPFSSGTAMEVARDGTVLTTKFPCPPICVASCYAEMVRLAEQVARGARTDYLRVDLLVNGRCEGLYVSEVELFPASDFDPALKSIVADRWRAGYGF